jgi:hypothetical protein
MKGNMNNRRLVFPVQSLCSPSPCYRQEIQIPPAIKLLQFKAGLIGWLFIVSTSMTGLLNLSTARLKRIIALKQKIERLSAQLQSLAGGTAAPVGRPPKKKWTMSAAARAKIAAAARRRWAKVHAAAKPAKKKRTMSAAARAKIAAAARERWAKIRAAKNK